MKNDRLPIALLEISFLAVMAQLKAEAQENKDISHPTSTPYTQRLTQVLWGLKLT